MTSIHVLPENVVNRIAAGEVLDRPASAVRELIENAVDARAKRITLQILQGGRDLIRVSDDGIGITEENLPVSMMRHATSKLPANANASDLNNIATLGFRGEALPAMGAVSKLSITSRADNAPSASRLETLYGRAGRVSPAPGGKGTIVEIRDIFHTTPARLKFLKSPRAEAAAISDVVRRLAMAHPRVGFTLRSGQSQVLSVQPEKGELHEARMARVARIMGKDFSENSVPIEAEEEGMRMTGYVGLPTYHRMGVAWQFFFVNGRPVRDRLIAGSVRAAYADLIPKGRNPVLAIFLDMSPWEVDVNVHPAKSEVRFRNARGVRAIFIRSIKLALERAGHRASYLPAHRALAAMRPEAPAIAAVPKPAHSYAPPPPPHPYAHPDLNAPSARVSEATHSQIYAPEEAPSEGPAAPHESESQPPWQSYPMGVAKAQLHKTYIVAETEEGLILVDQHAAHERIVHEAMKRALAENGVERQALLIPEVVELAESEAELVAAAADRFTDIGFLIERYAKSAVIVREIPLLCVGSDIPDLIRDLAEEISQHGDSSVLEDRLDEISGTIACHSSIRAGRVLNADEMNAILRQMERTPHAGQCNHGRPTYIALKRGDIEKFFERR